LPDLIVTSIAVDDAARQLTVIVDDFKNAETNRDQRRSHWGHPAVEAAMEDFVDDWWVKRAKLVENLGDLQLKMQKAAETWGEAEVQLTASLKPEEG